jgi:nicotinate-nucleotide pyrophosphorylase (carboxylating)
LNVAPTPYEIDTLIERALAEDLHGGDPTSTICVPAGVTTTARLVAKQSLVVCGVDVAVRTFTCLDPRAEIKARASDGQRLGVREEILRVRGDARALLMAERTALNFVQRLSGVATLTRAYVDAARGRTRITDTRKTTPGLRSLERHAVRCGGGHNHRNDLGGGILIKENHIRAAGGVKAAVSAAKRDAPHPLRIECEVTDIDELAQAIEAGAEIVLLDNMDDDEVRRALEIVAGRVLVEVSGGITLERVPRLAALGVDLVSVGALTHSAPAADISLLFDPIAVDGGT